MKLFKLILLVLSLVFFALNFVDYNIIEDKSAAVINEKFDPALSRLNSLSRLEAYVDSVTAAKNIFPGTLEYALAADEIVSQRFYHKYATQDLSENWIASIAQKITGLYLSSKITADDILTKSYGYCGQQNAVLMELVQKKGHDYRVVYLRRHFIFQSKIAGKWCYFDSDLEPDIPKRMRLDENWLKNKDLLALAYRKDTQWVNKTIGDPVLFKYGRINEVQGSYAQGFQLITKWLSKTAFLFPLICFVYLKRNKTRIVATIYSKQAA